MTNLTMGMITNLQKNLGKIEDAIGYTFANKDLLLLAFLDQSFPLPVAILDSGETNEDFVWRGNYLLQLAIADSIEANHHAASKPGKNSMLVKNISSESCLKYIEKLRVFDYYLYQLPHGAGSDIMAKIAPFKPKCFKALLTAIYLDSGKDFSKVTDLFIKHFSEELEECLSLEELNWKSLLNQWTQKHHIGMPQFTLVSQEGPAHAPKFTVQVVVDKKKLGEGTSGSKKEAEQIAAKQAYESLTAQKQKGE